MPRLAICSRDLHWQWINWAPLYDTMEVSMVRLTWLAVAQHVFQPALTGRLELISRKIVSCEPGTKAIAVSRFREKLSPANWVQGVTAISRKIPHSWAPKNGVQHATAIYPIPRYARPRYIGLTLYQIFRQAVTTSKGSFKVNPAKTKRASRASLMDLGDPEVTDRVSWLDQPSLQDTMVSTARIEQGLKDDEEVEKTTLSETLNTASSTFKFFTVKQIFPREPYRLKIHRDALYVPKPPGDHGVSDNKAPSSYQMSHRTCLDTEELARRSAIYASLADFMVASVIEELSSKDKRSKLLWEKLAIIQEAQVSAVSAGFGAASNLQLLRRDGLLKNFKFQPQVLSSVRTAPFEGSHVVGPEPKVLQNRVRAIRQADRMVGSSVTFDQKNREPISTKVTSSKKTAPRPSVFDRLGSPTSTPQRTVTQESPFRAGTGRARPWPFQGSKKSGKTSSSTSTRRRWRVPGGGSSGRLCPALAESAGQLPGHHRGRGGHCFPATASAHPSKQQFPDQERPSGLSASSRWLADEGAIEQVSKVTRLLWCLPSCSDASGCPQVSAFCGQQEGVPVHASSLSCGAS